jgi:hypothetical protein
MEVIMRGLDLIIHTESKVSIKDTTHSIDVSESKWDPLFEFLLNVTDSVYFYGLRVIVVDDELLKDVDFAAEEVFVNENYNRILFRVKHANMLNRGLLRNIWLCYDTAVLVFLVDKSDEDTFLEANYKNKLIKNCFTHIEGYFTVYQGMEDDVLWVNSDQNFSSIPFLV